MDEYPLPCEVILTDEVFYVFAELENVKVYEKINRLLGHLEDNPRLGAIYDPIYPAAKLPIECRVLYCGNYGIYYRHDEGLAVVSILSIVAQRRDPVRRFDC